MNVPFRPIARALPQDAVVVASGAAKASWSEIGDMRKHVPYVCIAETPGHFFKHADEQSIVGMAALAQGMERFKLDPRAYSQWGIVAAPRYMGRLAAASIVKRFAQGGIGSVSPHVLAQYSLHSVAGAI